ncbi:MAG: hypothetical protein GY859_01635 [Desulfobacterales bacterium]|nr:hypothetical protein [Desulfobacterales bacterium]
MATSRGLRAAHPMATVPRLPRGGFSRVALSLLIQIVPNPLEQGFENLHGRIQGSAALIDSLPGEFLEDPSGRPFPALEAVRVILDHRRSISHPGPLAVEHAGRHRLYGHKGCAGI